MISKTCLKCTPPLELSVLGERRNTNTSYIPNSGELIVFEVRKHYQRTLGLYVNRLVFIISISSQHEVLFPYRTFDNVKYVVNCHLCRKVSN